MITDVLGFLQELREKLQDQENASKTLESQVSFVTLNI
jgi:hypothetical protein